MGSSEQTANANGQQDAPEASNTTAEELVYPPGFEPELEGEELKMAIRKEKGYTWLVRFQLLFLALIVAFIIYSIVTS